MDYYTIAKRYYDKGYYGNEDVKIFVSSGKITPDQYKEITGYSYTM